MAKGFGMVGGALRKPILSEAPDHIFIHCGRDCNAFLLTLMFL